LASFQVSFTHGQTGSPVPGGAGGARTLVPRATSSGPMPMARAAAPPSRQRWARAHVRPWPRREARSCASESRPRGMPMSDGVPMCDANGVIKAMPAMPFALDGLADNKLNDFSYQDVEGSRTCAEP
jgi:hypothetical protein